MHPKSKHILFQCISLCKSLNTPLPNHDEKGKDKDDEEGDKSGPRDIKIPRTSSMLSLKATAVSQPSARFYLSS
jgi:hypothetical protein